MCITPVKTNIKNRISKKNFLKKLELFKVISKIEITCAKLLTCPRKWLLAFGICYVYQSLIRKNSKNWKIMKFQKLVTYFGSQLSQGVFKIVSSEIRQKMPLGLIKQKSQKPRAIRKTPWDFLIFQKGRFTLGCIWGYTRIILCSYVAGNIDKFPKTSVAYSKQMFEILELLRPDTSCDISNERERCVDVDNDNP